MNPKNILLLLCFVPAWLLATTFHSPTLNYLNEHSLESMYYYQYISPTTSLLLNDIANAETEYPVIGYHASTQKFRIFQDIVKGVVEEVLEYPVPEDFHFFRTPGMDKYDLPLGKQSFIDKFQRNPTTEGLDDMINLFVLRPFNYHFSVNITLTDFSERDLNEFRQFFLDFTKFLDTKLIAFGGYQDPMTKNLLLSDHNQLGETQIQLEESQVDSRESAHKKDLRKIYNFLKKETLIQKGLGQNDPFPVAMYAKKLGLILAKITKSNKENNEEIIHFLEQHFEPPHLVDEFFKEIWGFGVVGERIELFLFPFLDTRPSQQHLLACLNIPLHGNYFRWDESTVGIFLFNNSIEGGDHYIFSELEAFFNQAGLDKEAARELYNLAQSQLPRSTGVIFQFIDEDENYLIANKNFYSSLDFGLHYPYATPQEIILGVHPLRFQSIDLQLRLVIGNQDVLNPFSGFRVKRYEENSEETALNLRGKIKEYLKGQSVNQEKKKAFQEKLQKYWVKRAE